METVFGHWQLRTGGRHATANEGGPWLKSAVDDSGSDLPS